MKKIKLLAVMIISCVALAGCGIMGAKEEQPIDDSYEDVVDWLSIQSEEDKVFYIMRANNNYLEVPGRCEWVYTEGGEYPKLENGQIALVKADVSIYDGGEDGYCGNIFIEVLKESTIIDYETFVNECNPGELFNDDMDYENHILQYQSGDDWYLTVANGQYIDVYKNGEAFMEYLIKEYDDILEPARKALADAN